MILLLAGGVNQPQGGANCLDGVHLAQILFGNLLVHHQVSFEYLRVRLFE